MVVTNTTVAPLYLEKVTWALTHNNPNVSVESVILPDGEKYKDMVRVWFRLKRSERLPVVVSVQFGCT